jgi:5'-nucleotidase/UDP-sugar diphosphatase
MDPLDLNITISEKKGKKVVKWTPDFRFVDTATVKPDPKTQKMVDALKTKLDKNLGVVIGVTDVALDSRRNVVRSEESNMGDLVADAMKAATGADVALTNGGGIRGDRTYDPGTKLTRKDVLTELPFGNKTVVTEIPGSQLLAALENGFSQVENGAGRFPQVSGMQVVYDPKAPPGSRVASVVVNGTPLDMNKLYKVATNDYMLAGGDGYTALGGGKVVVNVQAGNLMANDVMSFIQKMGHVTEKVDGRIKTVGQ